MRFLPIFIKTSLIVIFRLIVASIFVCVFFVLTQNIQIFPGSLLSTFSSKVRDLSTLPNNVESHFIETSDHRRLELWRLASSLKKQSVIIFHGNAGNVENFFPYQEFFNDLGFTTYNFDYRGYGKSTGWPSERGLYLDADAMIKYVLEKDQLEPKSLIVVGISIGSGPAAYISNKYKIGNLILFSPFISMKEVVKSQPLIGFLHRFLFYKFPVKNYVKESDSTCLIVAHGEKDNVIPFFHGKEIFLAHEEVGESYFIPSLESSHNDILSKTYNEIRLKLELCLESKD